MNTNLIAVKDCSTLRLCEDDHNLKYQQTNFQQKKQREGECGYIVVNTVCVYAMQRLRSANLMNSHVIHWRDFQTPRVPDGEASFELHGIQGSSFRSTSTDNFYDFCSAISFLYLLIMFPELDEKKSAESCSPINTQAGENCACETKLVMKLRSQGQLVKPQELWK